MAFFSHGVYDFADSLLLGGRLFIIEDMVSLFGLACFSVIQAHIALRLVPNLKRKRQRSPIFVSVNVALSAGYIIGTILWMVNLCLKLQFVSRLQRTNVVGPSLCSSGYVPDPLHSELCQKVNSAAAQRTTDNLNWIAAIVFQFMLVLADSLLIYRCYIVLEAPWKWVISVAASLPLLGSFGIFVVVIAFRSGFSLLPLIGVYMSVLVNIIISPTLIGTLWRDKRYADSLMGNSRVGQAHLQYTRIIRTLVESALPPLVLGVIHIVLLAAFQVVSPLFNLVCISFTILAPQTIALRAVQRRDGKLEEAVSRHVQMTSIAFDSQTRALTSNEECSISEPNHVN